MFSFATDPYTRVFTFAKEAYTRVFSFATEPAHEYSLPQKGSTHECRHECEKKRLFSTALLQKRILLCRDLLQKKKSSTHECWLLHKGLTHVYSLLQKSRNKEPFLWQKIPTQEYSLLQKSRTKEPFLWQKIPTQEYSLLQKSRTQEPFLLQKIPTQEYSLLQKSRTQEPSLLQKIPTQEYSLLQKSLAPTCFFFCKTALPKSVLICRRVSRKGAIHPSVFPSAKEPSHTRKCPLLQKSPT